jgi:hypothetical protein
MATIIYNDTFPQRLSNDEVKERFKSADRYLRMLEEEGDTRNWQYEYMLGLYNKLASEVIHRKIDLP